MHGAATSSRGLPQCVALTCAALCIVLLYSLRRREATVTLAVAPEIAGPATQSSSVAAAIGQGFWLAQTPAQLRAIVHFCREAGVADSAELRSLALSSLDPLVAGNALRALGRLGAVARDPELIALLEDARPRVRQEVVIALGRSNYAPVVVDLLPLLDRDDPALRPLLLHALGRLGGTRGRERLAAVVEDLRSSEIDRAFARAALAAN